jgi:hypothetical protein
MRNRQLPIANCQLFAARRRFARGGDNRGQLARFLLQLGQSMRWYQTAFSEHLQPKLNFVCFLFGCPKLGDELRFRSAFACGAIVGSDGSSRASELICQDTSLQTERKFLSNIQDPEREFLSPGLHLAGSRA